MRIYAVIAFFLAATALFFLPETQAQSPNNARDWFNNQSKATIAISTSLSPAVDLRGTKLAAIKMPAAWTAAPITFQASADGTNYFDLHDSAGVEIAWTVAANQYVINAVPTEWAGVRYIKVRSGTSGSPVTQLAAAVITIIGMGASFP